MRGKVAQEGDRVWLNRSGSGCESRARPLPCFVVNDVHMPLGAIPRRRTPVGFIPGDQSEYLPVYDAGRPAASRLRASEVPNAHICFISFC